MTTIFLSDEDLRICETASPEDLKVFLNEIRQQQAEQEAAMQQARRERDERADQYFAANRSLVAAMQERDEAREAPDYMLMRMAKAQDQIQAVEIAQLRAQLSHMTTLRDSQQRVCIKAMDELTEARKIEKTLRENLAFAHNEWAKDLEERNNLRAQVDAARQKLAGIQSMASKEIEYDNVDPRSNIYQIEADARAALAAMGGGE